MNLHDASIVAHETPDGTVHILDRELRGDNFIAKAYRTKHGWDTVVNGGRQAHRHQLTQTYLETTREPVTVIQRFPQPTLEDVVRDAEVIRFPANSGYTYWHRGTNGWWWMYNLGVYYERTLAELQTRLEKDGITPADVEVLKVQR